MKLHPINSYTELYLIKKVESVNATTWATMASEKICNKPTTDFGTAMYNLDMKAIKVGEKVITDQVNAMADKVAKVISKNISENNETTVSIR